MKKFIITVLLILSMSLSAFAAEMLPCGEENVAAPSIAAGAGLVYSTDTDTIIYEKNADKKMNPYSVTKMVTVYLALKNLDMDKKVTISKKAANDIADGSTMKLMAGEVVTVRDLAYGAMIVSGNDAAMALAEAVSGSEKKFVQLMNKTVEEWGCANTHFTNAWGNKNKEHYTTARDLLTISKVVLTDEEIYKIITMQLYQMPKTNKSDARIMPRHTVLANVKNSGVIGGKTGMWEKSDTNVAALYSKSQLNLIFILLQDDHKQRVKDAATLFKYAHKVTPGYIVDKKGASTGSAWVRGGAKTRMKTELAKTIHAYPMKHRQNSIKTEVEYNDGLKAPIKKGTVIGTYSVYVDKKLVAKEAILASQNIEKGWILSNIYISNATAICLLVMAILAAALLIIIKQRKQQTNSKHATQSIGKH